MQSLELKRLSHKGAQTQGEKQAEMCKMAAWLSQKGVRWLRGRSRSVQFSSVAQSCLSLRPHESQHARHPCPSPTPGVYSNPCPPSR